MKPPIVFFGTGPVSLATLEGIVGVFKVEAIITKATERRVSNWAEARQIPYHTPASKDELVALFKTLTLQSQVGLVVDYGLIIPQSVLDFFPLGLINSHFSLLPEWRGADPITAVILSGQAETGVSLMRIVAALDEGPLLAQEIYRLPPDITIDRLTTALVKLSNQMIIKYLPKYLNGQLSPVPQAVAKPTYSQKLSKVDGQIDWRQPAAQIERQIRAYLGWPGSTVELAGRAVTITKAHVESTQGKPGEVWRFKGGFGVYCGKDSLVIDELKPAGKSAMSGAAFANGYLR